MTLYEYNALDLNNRMEIVNNKGTYLDTHAELTERCLLYAIDMFFVEVVYDIELNKIIDIHSFKTGHLLNKYSNYL
ncbi:hypothetical protein [Olleya namhaensis]|uniref:hypothetical protein n=1 Tax=Olleya namhaensis TaxID=1144750 RepID=UPI002492710A|nr:hypothetical protein [Olleya namhaensis]